MKHFRVRAQHTLRLPSHPHAPLLRETLTAPLPDAPGHIALLRLTRPDAPTRAPIILLHGFAMNRFTWHLRGRSLAGALAHAGYDTFLLELRGVGASRAYGSPHAAHHDDHILHDLPAAIRAVTARSGHTTTFLLGHSLGGLFSYATLHPMQHALRGLITFSGVFTSTRSSGLVRWFARLSRPALRGPGLDSVLPVQHIGRVFRRGLAFFDSAAARRLMPVHAWYPGSIERHILAQHARIGWDRSSLAAVLGFPRLQRDQELFTRDDQPLLEPFTHVDRPLLVVTTEHDTLLAHEDARVAYDASRSSDKTLLTFGPTHGHPPFGHLDMILGEHAPHHIWPALLDWLHARTSDP